MFLQSTVVQGVVGRLLVRQKFLFEGWAYVIDKEALVESSRLTVV